MDKVELSVFGLSYNQDEFQAHIVILSGEDGKRKIPIVIGGLEAQSIAIHIEGLKPPRPLTHDLFVSLALAFHIQIVEILIYKFERGIFYSELVCISKGKEVKIDTRTSDAIALSLRFNTPIYIYQDIFDKAGIIIDKKDEDPFKMENTKKRQNINTDKIDEQFDDMSSEKLNELLKTAIANESYESASLIKKEINKRKDKR